MYSFRSDAEGNGGVRVKQGFAGHLGVSRHKRLQMFTSLVTSAIRWLLCVVTPCDSNKLRVGHGTLTGWMLRLAAHSGS